MGMIGEGIRALRGKQRKLTPFERVWIPMTLLHFFLFAASSGLADPKAGIYSPRLRPEIWRSVLAFPLVTIAETVSGPLHPGEWPRHPLKLLMAGNSGIWGWALARLIHEAGRIRRKDRIWSDQGAGT